MQENVIENIVCKMEAILPWLQCVAVSSGCCALSAIVDDREQLRDIYIDFFLMNIAMSAIVHVTKNKERFVTWNNRTFNRLQGFGRV